MAELHNLSSNNSDGNGIVKLWTSANLKTANWKITGTFGIDFYNYFFVPSNYILDGDNFIYLFPFKYINSSVFVYYDDKPNTEAFWHLEKANNQSCELQTDENSRLPYVVKPNCGEPDYKPEKRFFIPVNGLLT